MARVAPLGPPSLVQMPEIPLAQITPGEKGLLPLEAMHCVRHHSWSRGLSGRRGWSPALCSSSGTLLSSDSPACGPRSDSGEFSGALLISLLGEAPELTDARGEQEGGRCVSGLAPHGKGA